MLAESTKKCTKCGESRPRSEFHQNRKASDGLQSCCKECTRTYNAVWYQQNKATKLARNKIWTEKNRNYHKGLSSRWYFENKPRRLRVAREWARNNPDKVAAKEERRRERLRNAPGGPYDPARYAGRALLYDGMCGYCLQAPYETWDHMLPVSRGGSNFPSNMMPACQKCNLKKGAKKFRFEWLPDRLKT